MYRPGLHPEPAWPLYASIKDAPVTASYAEFVSRFSVVLLLLLVRSGSAQSIDSFFKDTFEQMLRDDPELATAIGRHEYDDRWTDWSKSGREEQRRFFQERLKALAQFSLSGLSAEDNLTARLVNYDFRSQLDAWNIEMHLLRMGQLYGLHNRVYVIVDRMPARSVHDYENIIARLRSIPSYVDQNIEILNEAIAMKMTQPRIVCDLVTEQIMAQMNQNAAHTHLLDAFRQFPANIPKSQAERLQAEATDAYDKQFLPAWHNLHDYVATTYRANVRSSDSLSSIPGGREDYEILVRRLTTTNMSPDDIHRLGEQEVKRIESEMAKIATEIGFSGSLTDFQDHLKNSPEQHFHDKDEMLRYCRNIAKIIEPQLPNQFHHLPMLLYGVRPIPQDREAATATNAQAPSPDYTTPGWFNLNTYQPEKQVKYDKESLVLHEAVPGHIFQISLAQAQQDLPDIRKFYHNSAYIEGWALYAESLGSHLGLYGDPYSRFGQLASERFRAVRLVVDTGIHALGWTRQQAIEYFRVHAPEESLAEVDRYISWPAQALSYKMGQLRIRESRDQAEKQLGSKFDIRDFHDAVLRDGTLPLDLMTEQLNGFIHTAAAK